MKRFRAFAAWLAIAALLVDGMLPTAMAATTRADASALTVYCSGTTGIPAPGKPPPGMPLRHCALCAALFVASLPPRPDGFPARRVVGLAHPAAIAGIEVPPGRVPYAEARPRAPPAAT